MSYNQSLFIYILVTVSLFGLIKGNINDEEVGLNCTEVVDKYCNRTLDSSDCPEGYECYPIGAENPYVGKCFRDRRNCKPENSSCCDTTDCCRQVSDTNTAPLDCVQRLSGMVCKVLI